MDMQITLTALTNDKARLIVHTLATTDAAAADFVQDHWEERGLIVIRSEES